jgi:hypothetical protein
MTSKQRTWGQFATPPDVADLLLGFCLRRPDDRLLDPSCGDGALLRRAARWQGWLASAGTPAPTLYGVELDPDTAARAAALPGATIRRANFLALAPADYPPFDAVVGNPPYTRAEWIGRLDAAAGQLALFPGESGDPSPAAALLPREMETTLGSRAGLHAYFIVHSLDFLRPGGRLGFVVPNGWLDVGYGAALKQFLLDHCRVVAVVESAVERWFTSASVNTCLLILERASDPADRAANRARFVRLRRPLAELVGHESDGRRVAAVEQLVTRLLPAADRQTAGAAVRVREQARLAAGERWGALLRAPEVYLRRPATTAPLRAWAAVQRGYTTGANDFFYLDHRRIEEWGIAAADRRPLLKSLRGVHSLRLGAADCRHEALVVPADAPPTDGVAAYLAWGEARGIAARSTCAARRPWYALPEQPSGALLVAKGVWRRHFAAVAEEPLAVDQQIYRLEPAAGVPVEVAAALLNSAWFALACELGGRVNLGEGVLWLAAYELGELTLPDPRVLDTATQRSLADCFRRLAERPVADTPEALADGPRRALDDLVFDLLGLSAAEGEAIRAALIDCLDGRRRRARPPEESR